MNQPDNLPLYRGAQRVIRAGDRPHAGLWYDKFAGAWTGLEDECPGFDKKAWIARFVEASEGGLWQPELLGEMVERQRRLAAALEGEVRLLNNTSRFVTGLGRPHPVENGFAWHPTYGTPYLPGSGLKGVLRSWLHWQQASDDASLESVLGTVQGAGSIAFLDLLPMTPPRLVMEIMAPHYVDYYQDGATPGDWMNPIPIPFLAIEAGQRWQCAVIPVPRGGAEPAHHTKIAADALVEALAWLGAGAKTAVGYGRFELDVAAMEGLDAEIAEARRVTEERGHLERETAGLSPLAVEFYVQRHKEQWDADKNAFVQSAMYGPWLARLQADPDPVAIGMMRELVDVHFPGLLSDPDQTEGKKNKPRFKERQREFAKRYNALAG